MDTADRSLVVVPCACRQGAHFERRSHGGGGRLLPPRAVIVVLLIRQEMATKICPLHGVLADLIPFIRLFIDAHLQLTVDLPKAPIPPIVCCLLLLSVYECDYPLFRADFVLFLAAKHIYLMTNGAVNYPLVVKLFLDVSS